LIRKEYNMDIMITILTAALMVFPWFTTIMLFNWIRDNDKKTKDLQNENIELRIENRRLYVENQRNKEVDNV